MRLVLKHQLANGKGLGKFKFVSLDEMNKLIQGNQTVYKGKDIPEMVYDFSKDKRNQESLDALEKFVNYVPFPHLRCDLSWDDRNKLLKVNQNIMRLGLRTYTEHPEYRDPYYDEDAIEGLSISHPNDILVKLANVTGNANLLIEFDSKGFKGLADRAYMKVMRPYSYSDIPSLEYIYNILLPLFGKTPYTTSSLTSELAHLYLYENNFLEGNIYGDPDDPITLGEETFGSSYRAPGSHEYMAHRIIEPELHNYIFYDNYPEPKNNSRISQAIEDQEVHSYDRDWLKLFLKGKTIRNVDTGNIVDLGLE